MESASLEKGIVIVVCGHAYYGRYAYNLAASIKAIEDISICVMFNGPALSHLSADQLELFDYIIPLSESIKASTTCKLYAGEYTPFEKTLLLDADMLWLPKKTPSELFEELKDEHFTGITEGNESKPNPSYFFWADITEMKQKYKLVAEIHQWRSEVLYFDHEGSQVLKRALEVCETHKLNSVMNFAHAVPDELGINIATAEMGIIPHKFKWQPSYWPNMTGGIIKQTQELYDNYYLLSFGSNTANGTLKKVYGQLTQAAFYKIKKQNIFPLIEKKQFLPLVRNKM